MEEVTYGNPNKFYLLGRKKNNCGTLEHTRYRVRGQINIDFKSKSILECAWYQYLRQWCGRYTPEQ